MLIIAFQIPRLHPARGLVEAPAKSRRAEEQRCSRLQVSQNKYILNIQSYHCAEKQRCSFLQVSLKNT